MKRAIMMSLATVLALGVAIPALAETNTYFGFQIGVGNAPPPPRVVYTRAPRMVRVPQSEVLVLSDDPGYDMFRDGSMYYVSDNGYWYRSRSYRGPFVVVDARSVPRRVYDVPADRWHHRMLAGPPGQMNRGYDRREDRGYDHNQDRGHGRGHSKRHWKDQGHGHGQEHDDH